VEQAKSRIFHDPEPPFPEDLSMSCNGVCAEEAKVHAFHASGDNSFEVLEAFVVCLYCPYLNGCSGAKTLEKNGVG
jgi:hypothetical protein